MSIELVMERIATALEAIASNGTPLGQITEPTSAPKAPRKPRTAAATSTTAESQATTHVDAGTASTVEPKTDKETDDLFGDDPAPEVKEEKAKEVTMDDVRAKLVEVQTKFKHKDHALACLKHVSGGVILGGLKKEDYAKLVGVCTAALAKDAPPKF